MGKTVVVHESILRRWAQCVLTRVGLSSEDASIVADTLVEANLRGVDTHGVVRLPLYYLKRIKEGTISKTPSIVVYRRSPSVALIDADSGPGQVVTLRAMRLAIEMARESGVALVGVKNSSHFGMAAYFAMEALKEDMIGIAMTHADAWVAPFGARKPYLGTNPFSIAIPAKQCFPIVLDVATSITTMGAVILAALRGERIAEGIAIDEDGRITTDPKRVAALLPVGGPKGSGLAIIVDVVCGILTDSAFGVHINKGNDFSRPERLGHLVGAINVASFCDPDRFKQRVDEMISEIKSLPPAPGFSEVLLPGEKEFRTREERLKKGIPLPWEVFEKLQGLEGCYIDEYVITYGTTA